MMKKNLKTGCLLLCMAFLIGCSKNSKSDQSLIDMGVITEDDTKEEVKEDSKKDNKKDNKKDEFLGSEPLFDFIQANGEGEMVKLPLADGVSVWVPEDEAIDLTYDYDYNKSGESYDLINDKSFKQAVSEGILTEDGHLTETSFYNENKDDTIPLNLSSEVVTTANGAEQELGYITCSYDFYVNDTKRVVIIVEYFNTDYDEKLERIQSPEYADYFPIYEMKDDGYLTESMGFPRATYKTATGHVVEITVSSSALYGKSFDNMSVDQFTSIISVDGQ